MRFAHCLFLAFVLAAMPSFASQWSTTTLDYSKIKKSNLPDIVHVRIAVVVKVYENNRELGTVGLKPGVKLKVINIDRDGILEVRFAGAAAFIDQAATDFIERIGLP